MQQSEIAGEIGYFKLTDWWLSVLTPEEREHMESLFVPPTIIDDYEDERDDQIRPLTHGVGGVLYDTPVQLLTGIAGSLGTSASDWDLRHRLLDKAEESLNVAEGTPIGGAVDYFKLTDWWVSAFSAEERRRIDALCGGVMTEGIGWSTSQSAARMVEDVALTVASLRGDSQLVSRLLSKAEDLGQEALGKAESSEEADQAALDLHFLYGGRVEYYYRQRANPAAFDAAIEACEKQIAVAPRAAVAFRNSGGVGHPSNPLQPAHVGFRQLAIIRDKQGNFVEALRLSGEAKKQGWNDWWDNRIARLNQKLRKVEAQRDKKRGNP